MTQDFDVLGIGNAIVDVLVTIEDDFLTRNDIPKGSMQLVDETTSARLLAAQGETVKCSGGSAANTIAGLASLGSKSAYFGKISNDDLGQFFDKDFSSLGIDFNTTKDDTGISTAHCLVMVSPDAERTMCTYLGATSNLMEADIDPEIVAAATVTYMEGYLWDPENAKAAFRKAMTIAHEAGRKTSLSLSDSFCVGRYKQEFLHLVEHEIDILFANEDELMMLYGTLRKRSRPFKNIVKSPPSPEGPTAAPLSVPIRLSISRVKRSRTWWIPPGRAIFLPPDFFMATPGGWTLEPVARWAIWSPVKSSLIWGPARR